MPRRTQVLPRLSPRFRIRECHPLRCAFPCASPIMSSRLCRQPYNPIFAMVWAPPLSLAATHGIVLTFFSCRYLDVSVPCVSPRLTIYSSDDIIPLGMMGSPIRTSTGRCLLTARRRVSPFAASFFASYTLFLA